MKRALQNKPEAHLQCRSMCSEIYPSRLLTETEQNSIIIHVLNSKQYSALHNVVKDISILDVVFGVRPSESFNQV